MAGDIVTDRIELLKLFGQVIVRALSYPPELESKTLLLKRGHALDTELVMMEQKLT